MVSGSRANSKYTTFDRARPQVVEHDMVGHGQHRVVVCAGTSPSSDSSHRRHSALGDATCAGCTARCAGVEDDLFEVPRERRRVGDEWRRGRVWLCPSGEVLLLELGSLDELGWYFRRPGRKIVWRARETFFPSEDRLACGLLVDLDVVDEIATVVDCGREVI